MYRIQHYITNTSRVYGSSLKHLRNIGSLVALMGFIILGISSSATAQNSSYDIQLVLGSVDCINNTVCYDVELRSASASALNLAGQNYRLYYNTALGQYTSGVSFLPNNIYTNYTLVQNQQDLNASGAGGLPFESRLGFLNYSMDLVNLTAGGINLPADGTWITTSQICFDVEAVVFNDPNTCFEIYWAREGLTDNYFNAFVDIGEWTQANQLNTPTVRDYGDMINESCFRTGCIPQTSTNTNNNASCPITYLIEKLPTGAFQVSMRSDTFFNSLASPPENFVGSMQISLRMKTGGFQVSNFSDLLHTTNNWDYSPYISPVDNPEYDYVSFSLKSPTQLIQFQKGRKVPLFTFENGGTCTGDVLELIDIADPFYPPNTANANVGQQLSVSGFRAADVPICIDGSGVPDCTETCGIDYYIKKRSDGRFQVSMIPRVTYNPNTGENLVSTMQVTVKVHAGSFQVANITDLIHTSSLWDTTIYNQPVENPRYDYFSFGLISNTDQYQFVANQEVPLFTFENAGECTSSSVTLIDDTDPFYPPNTSNSNSGQHLTVVGYGRPDIPICVYGSGAQDCSTNCFFSCNDSIQVSLGLNCTAEILPDLIATAVELTCPGGTKTIEVRNLDNSIIPTSPMVNINHINQVFKVSIIDDFSGNSCWGSVIIKDKSDPRITCQDLAVNCSEDLDPTNPIIGYPSAVDNCTGTVSDLTYADEIDGSLCAGDYSAVINRTWTATDPGGHTATCVQQIFLNRLPFDDLIFPIDRDGIDAPVLPCTGNDLDPSVTGSPTLYGDSVYPDFEGLCEINTGFQDQEARGCGGSRQILRTWTSVNTCSGQFRTHVQVIKIEDQTAPLIECISDTLRQTTNSHDCTVATLNLPAAVVSDICSDVTVRMETPFGTIQSNGGVLEGATQGLHRIIYVATDECGHEARCTTMVRVVDIGGPTAICNNSQVAIGPTGWVDVNASTFDDGSFDECCDVVTFEVKRNDQLLDFIDLVSFSCDDIGRTIDVILQVTDCYDNTSQCTANILIINDNATNIQCPPSQTISCTTDFSDLNLLGAPTLLDNCGEAIFDVDNVFLLDSCGTGTISRNFSILDGGVVTGSCSQLITVENESTFDPSTIEWPHDYLSLACGGESLNPDELPYGFNKPKYTIVGSCNNLFERFTDSNFDNTSNAAGCYEIHRLWEVIDWCRYDVDNPTAGGIYTYTQIISVVNNVPPTLTCPTDITVDVTGEDCAAFVNLIPNVSDDCTPIALMDFTYNISKNGETASAFSGTTNNASSDYDTGLYTLIYTAADDCGNQSTCTSSFAVLDKTPPIANCFYPNLIIVAKSGDFAAVPEAAVIGLPSVDNCTPTDKLTFRVSPTFFTCDEIGNNTITLTVTDESGNSSSCNGEVTVIDASNLCPTRRTAIRISGNITNEDGKTIEEVMVSMDDANVVPSMTNQSGEFHLESVPVGLDYTIYPERNFDHLNGISTFDLVVLNRHILGVQYINSPYKLIAADINRSGNISTYDLVILRRMILRLIDKFPNNTSWRFIKKDFTFDNPANPLGEYFPEVYNIKNTPSNDMQVGGFIAVKIGDINNSANTSKLLIEGESRRASNNWSLLLEDQVLEAGDIVDIPIKAKDCEQLLGFQFALQYKQEAVEILSIRQGELPAMTPDNFGLTYADRGIITTSWQQAAAINSIKNTPNLFILKVRVKATTRVAKAFSINKDFMKAEAYLENGDHTLPTLLDVAITTKSTVRPSIGSKLYQNRPNPFSQSTIIGFELATAQEARLTILDVTGKIVKQHQANFQAGYQEVNIRKEELQSKGIYYYQLETIDGIETKKMIIIE